jgi:signal transduction histidine kinase
MYNVDSLKASLEKSTDDKERVQTLSALSFHYGFINTDSGIMYGQDAINLMTKIECKKCEAYAFLCYSWALANNGTHDKAVEYTLKAMRIYEELKDYEWIISCNNSLANIYTDARDYNLAIKYNNEAIRIYDSLFSSKAQLNEVAEIYNSYLIRAAAFVFAGVTDSANYYINKIPLMEGSFLLYTRGNIEFLNGNDEEAIVFFKRAIPSAINYKTFADILESYAGLSAVYLRKHEPDSAIYFGMQALNNWSSTSYKVALLKNINRVAAGYEMLAKNDSAVKYLELGRSLNDSLYNQAKIRRIQNLDFAEQLHKREIETATKEYRDKIRLFGLVGVLAAFLLIAIILYRNNRQKQKANDLLKAEKEKVDQTLKALKSTQAQLIQTEKMASLGELTAGIAHEIQNPLNFVNNFSEVNTELLNDLKNEISNGNLHEANSIAENLIINEHKINQHGKRADSIVKGMLQHSRTSTGQKELIDINTLSDEYLRLAYHGYRAKNPSFSVATETQYDPATGKININGQDIGRVLLNLLNNAFYSVSEKKKSSNIDYEPKVIVTTHSHDGKVEITVKDNGTGIPAKWQDKIFQPFFTTKPAGLGTGLGLSLSYDIIKAHGGQIRLNSTEGEGSTFIIDIPA